MTGVGDREDPLAQTKRSWNAATRMHNAHKGDQAARLRAGEDWLFDEELALLGDLRGTKLVHLQCNSGQDSLCLARRGAEVTGVDFSDEAIAFAQRLSRDSGIPGQFVESEVVSWLHSSAPAAWDVAFCSYGVTSWLPDLAPWAAGIRRVLRPGGRFVYVDFHPLVWSIGPDLRLSKDDYFEERPFVEPVEDYVATAGPALAALGDSSQEGQPRAAERNGIPAHSYQHGLGGIVDALAGAGLVLERLREYPWSNGARVNPALVPAEGRRWVWPEGTARVPLMFGLVARAPSAGAA